MKRWFLAGVRPQRTCGKLTRAECVRLVTAIKNVLENAIRAGGTTLRDYFGVDGETGYFKIALNVYGRGGKPCLRLHRTIEKCEKCSKTVDLLSSVPVLARRLQRSIVLC